MEEKMDFYKLKELTKDEIISLENKLNKGVLITPEQVCRILMSVIPANEEDVVCAMKNIAKNDIEKLPTITEIFSKFFTIEYELNDNSFFKDNYIIHVKTNNIPRKIRKTIIELSNQIDDNKKYKHKSDKQLLEDLGK